MFFSNKLLIHFEVQFTCYENMVGVWFKLVWGWVVKPIITTQESTSNVPPAIYKRCSKLV